VATTLLAVAILLSGALAYFRLPVAPLPNVTYPVIVVQAAMAGASPDIMPPPWPSRWRGVCDP